MAEELKSDRYRVEARIGQGGMGVVFRAYDTRLARRVALKMVPGDVGRDSDLLRRLSLEARSAAAISHPGVAAIYDFEEHGSESFIVYEYVEGVTLRDRLAQRRFSIEEVIETGMQIADALAAAHEHGIVHRDLKPENVMVVEGTGGRRQIKILDFGLAKWVRPLTHAAAASSGTADLPTMTGSGMMVGTINYMSPEQVQGQAVDSRTDLYALGVVLYEMVTGTNPFHGDNPASTIANILTRDPPPLPDLSPGCPPEVDRVLRKCLRKAREERYPSARELLSDLSRISSPQSYTAVPDTAGEQMSRGLARGLFVVIQAGYLAMYATVFWFPAGVDRLLAWFEVPHLAAGVMASACCGAALRLYLISAAGLDYPNTGKLFRSLFPAVLALDAFWAAAPLLLFEKAGYPVLLLTAALACLPFSQRTLISYAYAPRGGRISTTRSAITAQRSST